jgi:predicted nucleic acid-binding protein
MPSDRGRRLGRFSKRYCRRRQPSPLRSGCSTRDFPLHAPHLIDVEVAQVLRRYAATGQIEPARCRDAIDALQDFPMPRYPHHLLLARVWELRHNLTAYDAVYVELAEVLDARLLTRDRRIAAAAGHRATVELV